MVRQWIVAVVLVSAGIGGVYAEKVCGFLPAATLPGIDVNGNISMDGGLAGAAQTKICLQTRNGKVKLVADANVTNESGATQKFKDPNELLGDPGDVKVVKAVYKVKASGKAHLVVVLIIPADQINALADQIRAL